jgi:hypothetical protein
MFEIPIAILHAPHQATRTPPPPGPPPQGPPAPTRPARDAAIRSGPGIQWAALHAGRSGREAAEADPVVPRTRLAHAVGRGRAQPAAAANCDRRASRAAAGTHRGPAGARRSARSASEGVGGRGVGLAMALLPQAEAARQWLMRLPSIGMAAIARNRPTGTRDRAGGAQHKEGPAPPSPITPLPRHPAATGLRRSRRRRLPLRRVWRLGGVLRRQRSRAVGARSRRAAARRQRDEPLRLALVLDPAHA